MKMKDIKTGHWYQTKAGYGKVLDSTTKYHPPVVRMNIVGPFPRGISFVPPRDVLNEIDPPKEQVAE